MTIIADIAGLVVIAQATIFITLTLYHWRRESLRHVSERIIEVIQPIVEANLGLPQHTLDPLNDSSTSTESTMYCKQPCNCRSCRETREEESDSIIESSHS